MTKTKPKAICILNNFEIELQVDDSDKDNIRFIFPDMNKIFSKTKFKISEVKEFS